MKIAAYTVYIETEDTEAASEALRAIPGFVEYDFLGEESY